MYLVKKKYLYMLTLLVIILLIFGEIRFFHVINSLDLKADLKVKYEVENFIFAAILLVIAVGLFLVNMIRSSLNILKRLDKMIEVSEYGKLDVSSHLKPMGRLGIKVKYLLYYLDKLNEMRALKISSLSGINDYLLKNTGESIIIFDALGKVVNCSLRLLETLKVSKKDLMGVEVGEVLKGESAERFLPELKAQRKPVTRDKVVVAPGRTRIEKSVTYTPVFNSENEISHVICVIGR